MELDPIRPSAATRDRYQRQLDRLIEAMARDISRQIKRAWVARQPMTIYALDDSPSRTMGAILKALRTKWEKQFDERAANLSEWFATAVHERCDRELREALRKAGMSVKFTMTAAMNDAFQAVKLENISLISSIPAQHMTQVETLVMQSVSAGRDLSRLAKGLEDRVGVTKRRAALIARDQNNKATAAMQRARQLGMGITEGRWLHSAGGKVPRERHVAFSGNVFPLADGHDFGDGEGPVLPGQLINCRCVWKAVVPGFDD